MATGEAYPRGQGRDSIDRGERGRRFRVSRQVRVLRAHDPRRGARASRLRGGLVIPISLTVNGVRHEAEVEPRTLLVDFLRDDLGLTGTKIGCDTSLCGACTIHLDGRAVKSCTVLAVQADGSEITTIEGLAHGGELHPLQEAFWEHH